MNPLSQLFSAIGPSGMGPLDTPMWNQRLDLSTPMNNLFRGPMVTPIQQQSPMTMTTPIQDVAPQQLITPPSELGGLGTLFADQSISIRDAFGKYLGEMLKNPNASDIKDQWRYGSEIPQRLQPNPNIGLTEEDLVGLRYIVDNLGDLFTAPGSQMIHADMLRGLGKGEFETGLIKSGNRGGYRLGTAKNLPRALQTLEMKRKKEPK